MRSQTVRISQSCLLSRKAWHTNAIGWIDLVNFLREHLELCGCSTALFLAEAACPYVLPKPAVEPLHHVFPFIAFPLVGVSSHGYKCWKNKYSCTDGTCSLAPVFMGNSLEGGLLLAMFNLVHMAEDYFTSCSKVDMKQLKENYPNFALVLYLKDGKSPEFSDMSCQEVPVNDLEVGSYILVKADQQLLLSI
ncbi:hypothetical protein F0562_003573 [Nyssa sinensis]|uniref:Uncharacterized protein n=1 Tax=Nyssa sinensis TaxID=561372 RepID=A0A5J5C162_9ASTE|nr:hypothetical protein F0562_003573 [Nyssa sinensis]